MSDNSDVIDQEVEEAQDTSALADIMAAVEASEKAQTDGPAPKAEKPEKAPAKESAAPEAEAPAAEAPKDGEAEKPAATEGKTPDPLATWKQADREMFKELPESAQNFLLRREQERDASHNKKLQEIAEFRKEYSAVDEMFAPYKAQMAQSGFTPYGIIQAWRNVETALLNGQGEQVVRDIIKNYRLDPNKILSGQTSAAPRAELTPEQQGQAELEALLNPVLTPLQKEIAELKGKLAQSETFQSTYQQEQQRANIGRVQNEIASFANEKDDKGNLAHPYFKDVEDQMGYLALTYKQAGQPVPNLKELYDYAVWANTSTRERLLAAQRQAATSKSTEEARAKAVASRRAGSSVSGSPRVGQKPNGRDETMSVRGAIEAAFEDISER